MSSFKIVAVTLLAGFVNINCSVLAPAVAPLPVPAVRYIQVAPPNIHPFAAQVSTFTKGLNIFAAPFAAGVLPGPAVVPRALVPAPVAPVLPGPAVAPIAPAPIVPFGAPLPAPVAPVAPIAPAQPIFPPVGAPVPYYPSLGPLPAPVIPGPVVAPSPLLPAPFVPRSIHAVGPGLGPALHPAIQAVPL